MTSSIPASPLQEYQLGDSLGKGAFAHVYRALNRTTGETVAVKQFQLGNIAPGELKQIMLEIDLLKKLNHPNIVKYKGYVKTRENLHIILEYCENGSLYSICKRFGTFSENLVGVYIVQVLEGLVYLHDQGVIHRDIKGANILTNKDGTVKLADFGLAAFGAGTEPDREFNNGTVVGSPYWMAPEVIEQSGARTASDIWSVGCVVIELLEGRPPYHFLAAMPALFRIVQDDCPPIPEGASPIVKDFLYHCFQKDCNLRISAKKLLRHPWMVSTRRNLGGNRPEAEKRPSSYDAVQQVQEWNEALKSPTRKQPVKGTPRFDMREPRFSSPAPGPSDPWKIGPVPPVSHGVPLLGDKIMQPAVLCQAAEQIDNWDDDFEEAISFTKFHSLEKTVADEEERSHPLEDTDKSKTIKVDVKSPSLRSLRKVTPPEMNAIVEGYSDLAGDDDSELLLQEKVANFKAKNLRHKGIFHPDDISTVGLNGVGLGGPSTAPLTKMTTPTALNGSMRAVSAGLGYGSRSPLCPLPSPSIMTAPLHPAGHQRSVSLSGSTGRSEPKKQQTTNELVQYTEDDEEDYDDIFAKPNGTLTGPSLQTLQLTTRLSNKSWLGDIDSDEEDPFAEIDEGFIENDLETNLVRDKLARLCSTTNKLIDQLTPISPDSVMQDTCDGLLAILEAAPEIQYQLVPPHGMLAILDVMGANPSSEVAMKLLRIVKLLVTADIGLLESFCLIGGIPIVMAFTTKRYPPDCRLEASYFIRLLCHSSALTLLMFISCRGLRVLVELLDEDFAEQPNLVICALNGIKSVFELQGPTPTNVFCRMLIREGLLDPLSSALLSKMPSLGESTPDTKLDIIQIVLMFCQISLSDTEVRQNLGTGKIIHRLFQASQLLEPEHLVIMLKAVKLLSMNATLLDTMQNANAIKILVRILQEQSSGPHSPEIASHGFQTCFNLCRLNKSRQEEAAQGGIIPLLKRAAETNSPLKQFALPILCDLANAGKSCHTLLWQHDVLSFYLQLLSDQYFQVPALESIGVWLQDETARVEDYLTRTESISKLVACFVSARTNAFENLLDPFLKVLRISTAVAVSVTNPKMLPCLINHLRTSNKAVVRLNLLRLLRVMCDAHPDGALLMEKYDVLPEVERLGQKDGAVLVRELAQEIILVLRASPPAGGGAGTPDATTSYPERKPVQRTVSEGSFLGSSITSTKSDGPSGLTPRVPSGGRLLPLRSNLPSRQAPPPNS